jgi:single-strand DNA-binding protein
MNMSDGVNKVTLLGNLGADPELRYTSGGHAVCDMRIATSRSFTNKAGERQQDTQWHRITVWGKQAEQCKEYLHKGRQIFLEGRLQTRQWEDRDGNKRYTTEVVAHHVLFLGNGNGNGKGADAPPPTDTPPAGLGDDDIPF